VEDSDLWTKLFALGVALVVSSVLLGLRGHLGRQVRGAIGVGLKVLLCSLAGASCGLIIDLPVLVLTFMDTERPTAGLWFAGAAVGAACGLVHQVVLAFNTRSAG
jgi:hypothetical protein